MALAREPSSGAIPLKGLIIVPEVPVPKAREGKPVIIWAVTGELSAVWFTEGGPPQSDGVSIWELRMVSPTSEDEGKPVGWFPTTPCDA